MAYFRFCFVVHDLLAERVGACGHECVRSPVDVGFLATSSKRPNDEGRSPVTSRGKIIA
jgi:hypothetical protein